MRVRHTPRTEARRSTDRVPSWRAVKFRFGASGAVVIFASLHALPLTRSLEPVGTPRQRQAAHRQGFVGDPRAQPPELGAAVERLPLQPVDTPEHEAEGDRHDSRKPILSMAGWHGDRAMSRRAPTGPRPLAGSSTAGLDAHFDAGQDKT
jgi:hypothetical protein